MRSSLLDSLRTWLKSRQNIAALATLPVIGIWIFFRVREINPAILGDEYLYSVNAIHTPWWGEPPAGDFSNVLFNFTYSVVGVCGDSFYQCAKLLNIGFYLGFVLIVFLIASKFLQFGWAYTFMVLTSLSPLSVYTSMFLPESMFFFVIGLTLMSVLRSVHEFTVKNWAIAGIAVGTAALVKPHAWLSLVGFAIVLLVVGLSSHTVGATLRAGLTLVVASLGARFLLGLALGGLPSLSFFGVYIDEGTLERAVVSNQGESGSDQTPIGGVIELFPLQLGVHSMVLVSIVGVSIAGILTGLRAIVKSKSLEPASAFALVMAIWGGVLVLEIVAFTGWVTGLGDDHTSRVLLRYYDFLFIFLPLAGLAVFKSFPSGGFRAIGRWSISIALVAVSTNAFTAGFSGLEVQIADAPNLAGLIVDRTVYSAAATIGFLAAIVYASFPRFTIYGLILLFTTTSVGSGWHIQDQYDLARGQSSPADRAGLFLRDQLTLEERQVTWVLAGSRFDATNVGFWASIPRLEYQLYLSGAVVDPAAVPANYKYVLSLSDISVDSLSLISSNDDFNFYVVD